MSHYPITADGKYTYQKNMGFVSEHRGAQGNAIMIISGFNETSTVGATNFILDVNSLKVIEDVLKKTADSTTYFDLVLEIEGIEHSDFTIKLLHVRSAHG